MSGNSFRNVFRRWVGFDVRRCRHTCFTSLAPRDEVVSLINCLHPVHAKAPLIRLGPRGDGGYLVPDCFDGIKACFSPGVNDISGFDVDCANLGIPVYLADASVDFPADEHELFSFKKKYIGAFSEGDFISIDSWVNSCLGTSSSDLILQMDIEGFEYEAILAMSDSLLERFRIIVVELHLIDQLWNHPFFTIASRAIRKLLWKHKCVHIHPNNVSQFTEQFGLSIPSVMEFTFVRNELATQNYRTDFPHPLDFDNTGKSHQVLPRCWFR
jgi:hypothetical protein